MRERSSVAERLRAVMGVVAKVIAGIGAALLLLSGLCFLALRDGSRVGDISTPWVVGVTLIVGGVVAVVALLGLAGER